MRDNAFKNSNGESRMIFLRCLGSAFVVLLLVAAAIGQESYDQLLHDWDYDKSAPLNIKQVGIEERNGVTIYDISFSSPVGERRTAVGPEWRYGYRLSDCPPRQGPLPAVIFGHWCMPGSDKENRIEFLDEAIVLAHSGVVSLLPDHVIVHPWVLGRLYTSTSGTVPGNAADARSYGRISPAINPIAMTERTPPPRGSVLTRSYSSPS